MLSTRYNIKYFRKETEKEKDIIFLYKYVFPMTYIILRMQLKKSYVAKTLTSKLQTVTNYCTLNFF